MVAQVIPFRRQGELTAAVGDVSEEPVSPQVRVIGTSGDDFHEPSSGNLISTEDLYSNLHGVSSELGTGMRLLTASEDRIAEALVAARNMRDIAADDALQRFQSMLPELFCLRTLGDGFGMIVNALICVFENLGGMPLTEQQISGILRLVKKVRSEPFLQIDEAMQAITALETAGLVVEPPELDVLADLLGE